MQRLSLRFADDVLRDELHANAPRAGIGRTTIYKFLAEGKTAASEIVPPTPYRRPHSTARPIR